MGWVSKKKCTICKKEFETDVETDVCVACLLRPTRANFAYVTPEETRRLSRRKEDPGTLKIISPVNDKEIVPRVMKKTVAKKKPVKNHE